MRLGLFLALFIAIIASTYADVVAPKVELKMAVILSGYVDDLGYNFMVNKARVQVEKQLQLRNTRLISGIVTDQQTLDAMEQLVAEGYNLIIGSSFEHTKGSLIMAEKYPEIIFLVRDVGDPKFPNTAMITFNFGVPQYLFGYLSAFVSKTRSVGIVIPGPPAMSYATANAFFVGVQDAVRVHGLTPVQVHSIETGSWYDPDLEIGATKSLIDKGVDVFSMSQDDLSVHETALTYGVNVTVFGTSGYPIFDIFGEGVLTSIITDWTPCFRRAAEMVIAGNFTSFIYWGDISDDMGVDDYSYLVSNDTVNSMKAMINTLTNNRNYTSHPYYCSEYYRGVYDTDANGCVTNFQLLASPNIVKEIIDSGRYTIPPVQHLIKQSITYGFSIVSGIAAFFGVLLFIGIVVFRETKIMRSASPIFCMAIVYGGLLIFSSIIVWVQTPTTDLCRARIWLISLGYTIMLGNMVVKNFRIWLIFDNPHLKKLKITNGKLIPYVGAVILLNCIILAVYTGAGDIVSVRSYGKDGISQYDYRDTCAQNRTGNIVLYILLGYHAIMLLVGCFVSWKIRIVDIAEFNESKPIANTLYAISFCLFIIIPLMVAQQSLDSQIIIICTSALFTTASSLVILFMPKFWRLYTKGVNADPFSSASSMSFAASVGGQTKRDDGATVEMSSVA
eukprot:gene7766-9110_t